MRSKRIEDELLVQNWPKPRALEANSVIVVTGPTASGKSSLALRLAKHVDAEIVCCDSMQIYRHLDIGTAKPSLEDQKNVPHHLFDICEVSENYSVARYVQAAKACIADILKRGRRPLLVGGTTLYVSALVEQMNFPEAEFDHALRKKLFDEAGELGNTVMYQRLVALDPEYAASVHPNNTKRVLRALERLLGSQLSNDERSDKHAEGNAPPPDEAFDYRVFCQSLPREKLYERINKRVDSMLDEGLLNEVQWLMEQDLPPTSTCMQAIGYKEMFPYILKEQSLAEATERLKANTRQYAKRQLTWYRAKGWPLWLFPKNIDEAIEAILQQLGLA